MSDNSAQAILDAIIIDKARSKFINFAGYIMDLDFEAEFHRVFYTILDLFAQGIIPRLMITVPPQHGKSEGTSRLLPAYLLGKNPDKKIILGSYAASLAQDFCRDVQRNIDSEEFRTLFPQTYLSRSNVVSRSNMYKRNMNMIECVGHKGFLKVAGRGGGLTGTPADVAILDDIYKDAEEGNSPIIRDKAWAWYISVILKRLHNDSQQLIVFTRWHEDDLIGRIKKRQKVVEATTWNELLNPPKDGWIHINFPALMDHEKTSLDHREMGEALYPQKHSKEKLEVDRSIDPLTFDCMNQGNPRSAEGMLYAPFKTYVTPEDYGTIVGRGNYTDCADTGTDYLCSINYLKVRSKDLLDDKGRPLMLALVTDMVYTDKGTEYTVPQVADMLNRENIEEADIESNNGGKGFADQVRPKLRRTIIRSFTQSKNKESRIITNAALVNVHIIFPLGWENRFVTFHEHVTGFRRNFAANTHDDAPDVLTGIVEKAISFVKPRGVTQKN